jgi:hypothetical protein
MSVKCRLSERRSVGGTVKFLFVVEWVVGDSIYREDGRRGDAKFRRVWKCTSQ